MITQQKHNGERVTSKQSVELYFARIRERQRLEEEYYRTGNKALLVNIDKAREQIREVMIVIGIKL